LLIEELWAAVKKGLLERAELLVAHGVELNTPGSRDGRTPYEEALLSRNRAIAELLACHGASRIELGPEESFAAACMAGDREQARALLAPNPSLIDQLGPEKRGEMLSRAVEARNPAGVRLMAELGFELSPLTRNTPLHDAAWAGDLETVKLLIELGADPSVRDREFDATPLGWASHNHQHAVVEYPRPLTEGMEKPGTDCG